MPPLVKTQLNGDVYYQLHTKLLHQPSRREKQLKLMIEDIEQVSSLLKSETWDRKVIYPKFIFETVPTRELQQEFLRWWKQSYGYAGSPVINVTVKMCTTMNRTLESFLIRTKPTK